jgi:hypothetical protein
MSMPVHLEDSKLTAGLNNPPLMRKKIQALTARLNPNESDMYNSFDGSTPPVVEPVVVLFAVFPEPIFATCVPPNAKKRKKVVPTNSPIIATASAIL